MNAVGMGGSAAGARCRVVSASALAAHRCTESAAGAGERAACPGATLVAQVEALRASFAACERAYAISDADAARLVDLRGEQKPRLAALTLNLTHDWEHYGKIVTYLRLKGMVPPSSQTTK